MASFEGRLRKELVNPDFSWVDLALVYSEDDCIVVVDNKVLLFRINNFNTVTKNQRTEAVQAVVIQFVPRVRQL